MLSPGVLAYGSQHSRARRDFLNVMCDGLPVPYPSIAAYHGGGGTAWGQPCAVSAVMFSGTFNNARGGCFGAGSMVRLADGGSKPIELLCKGDSVLVPCYGGVATACNLPAIPASAEVVCVIAYSGVRTLELPGSGLRITPWHPIRINGKWRFPADVVAEAAVSVAAASAIRPSAGVAQHSYTTAAAAAFALVPPGKVYNLVLGTGHVILVDGVEAVTLGHGFTDDGGIVSHPYFGTEAVLKDLQAAPGWQQGWVDLGAVEARIDDSTGLVSGFTAASVATKAYVALPQWRI